MLRACDPDEIRTNNAQPACIEARMAHDELFAAGSDEAKQSNAGKLKNPPRSEGFLHGL
jgi:hypothetical protein